MHQDVTHCHKFIVTWHVTTSAPRHDMTRCRAFTCDKYVITRLLKRHSLIHDTLLQVRRYATRCYTVAETWHIVTSWLIVTVASAWIWRVVTSLLISGISSQVHADTKLVVKSPPWSGKCMEVWDASQIWSGFTDNCRKVVMITFACCSSSPRSTDNTATSAMRPVATSGIAARRQRDAVRPRADEELRVVSSGEVCPPPRHELSLGARHQLVRRTQVGCKPLLQQDWIRWEKPSFVSQKGKS